MFDPILPLEADVDQVHNKCATYDKIISNGQLYIIRDGKTYSVTGQEVR